MKIIITLLLLSTIMHVQGQKAKKNNSKKVNTSNIYNNEKNLIDQVIVETDQEKKLYLLKGAQVKDSSNFYITRFDFSINKHTPLFSLAMSLKFSASVISVDKIGNAGVLPLGLTDNLKEYRLNIIELSDTPSKQSTFALIIKSESAISTIVKLEAPKIKSILTINNSDYWQKVNPVNFMDTLIAYGNDYIFNIEARPLEKWFDKKCIKKLEKLRNDSVYCSSILTPLGEEFGDGFCDSTTITQEVNHLIEGIREKNYPYYRSSCSYNENERKRKLSTKAQ